ncbi:LAFA_0F11342g1_1 [Lachancea sp. 'fantastica']|nr:LAFA_0F11342g1_1 [Lachancea sp. 'fantastica']
MLLGPSKPPQISAVPLLKTDEDCVSSIADEALQALHLPYSNCMVVLTTKQILVYNYKPMALVSSFLRSDYSLEKYGENKRAYADSLNKEMFQDLIPKTDIKFDTTNSSKVTFYVTSSLNFVFVFEILLSSGAVSLYKETGIPILDINKVDHDYGQDIMNNTEDDDTLTVFDRKESTKVIQNGYAVDKQQGFLHFLTKSADTLDEIPIKKVELRLQVMFSFGRSIIDLAGFCDTNSRGESKRHEYLMLLFPNRVHVLVLQNFQMKDNILIDVPNGYRLLQYHGKPCVVSVDAQLKTTLTELDLLKKCGSQIQLNYDAPGPLLDIHINNNVLTFVHEFYVSLYDLNSNTTIKRIRSRNSLICSGSISSEDNIMFTKKGFKMFTRCGNCIVSTFDDDEDGEEDGNLSGSSSFTSIGGSIVTTSLDGKLSKWDLWSKVITPFNNFRNSTPLILQTENNDMMLFAPTSDSLENVPFQVIKLPSQTINNHVPLVRTNGSITILAAFVSNKSILLIHNLVTNSWLSFMDLNFIDVQWLGDEYLFCHSLGEDMKQRLQCYHFPAQGSITPELSDRLIWDYAISPTIEIKSIHANTLSRYKLLKVKSKNSDNEQLQNLFKTAEVLIQDDQGGLRTIDIISKIGPGEAVEIKVFHQHPAENVFSQKEKKCQWIMNHNGGYFVSQGDQILKLEKTEEGVWKTSVLLEKVERTLDIIEAWIYVVQDSKVTVHNIEELWNAKGPVAVVEITEGDYPVVISPEAAIVHSVQFVISNERSKIIPRQAIYLDQVIDYHLAAGTSYQNIDSRYRSLQHYKFSLEKILSGKVLTNEPLSDIVSLINFYDQGPKHSGRLEIISNCLRKIEVEHWDYLFQKLNLSPRDLLVQCIEHDEARVLGILLMVFLNYDGSKKTEDLRQNQEELPTEIQDTEPGSISTILNDEELMLQVLRVLVNTASSSCEREEAREFWDMSFQLVRFIQALDNENKTSLVQRAVQILS